MRQQMRQKRMGLNDKGGEQNFQQFLLDSPKNAQQWDLEQGHGEEFINPFSQAQYKPQFKNIKVYFILLISTSI